MSNVPYDFTANPDVSPNANNIPPASDFFWYNKIGNTAFIAFSGAHSYQQTLPYFEEACQWASTANADAVVLLGHWNSDGDGCESDMTVQSVYSELMSLKSCAPISSKLKYFVGHKHCNIVLEDKVGFMVGGQGMGDATACGGSFGIPVVDTTGGSFKVYFFPIAQANAFDNYDTVLNCIKSSGVSKCYHLATQWV